MLMDISPPRLGRVFIFGELTFQDNQDYNLTASLVRERLGGGILKINVVFFHVKLMATK